MSFKKTTPKCTKMAAALSFGASWIPAGNVMTALTTKAVKADIDVNQLGEILFCQASKFCGFCDVP